MTPFYEPAYSMGGLAMLTANLARAQARAGASVSVFTTTAGLEGRRVNTEGEDRNGVRVYYFPAQPSRLFFSWAFFKTCLTHTTKFDIVHIHGLWYSPGTWGALATSRSLVPYVLSPQGALNHWAMRYKAYKKRPYWWLLERRTVLGARRIHFTTKDEAAQARTWIGNHPTTVIPVAVEAPHRVDPVQAAAWRAGMGIPVGPPLVGFLGRIHPVKGLDLLVDAIAQIREAHLIIAGPDESATQASLTRRAAALGIASRVHWPGVLNATGRGAMLAGIDLFVLPSHTENFGLAAAEAMAVGVPVMVTPGVNLAGVIAEVGAGRVVPRDPAKMAEALSTLLADAPTRMAMGMAGRRLVEERFSPQAVARQMLDLYEECLT